MRVSDQKQIEFLLFIQRILEEGQFVSTYKFALLQAIANISVERGAVDSPLVIDSRQLAEQFVRLYWRQTNEFRGHFLLQNNGDQAAILNLIKHASDHHNGSIVQLSKNEQPWKTLISNVAIKVVEMPLWRLQIVANENAEFLYTRGQRNNQIVVSAEIAFCFRQFYSLVIELTQSAWTNFVRSIRANHEVIGADGELNEFLFGADRAALAKYAGILAEFQSGHCFYCERQIPKGAENVDHFVPWSRYPSDLGHNFVLADSRCNNQKRDRLASTTYLAKWAERNKEWGDHLSNAFAGNNLPHSIEASGKIAYFVYERAERTRALVWSPPRELQTLDAGWRTVLSI